MLGKSSTTQFSRTLFQGSASELASVCASCIANCGAAHSVACIAQLMNTNARPFDCAPASCSADAPRGSASTRAYCLSSSMRFRFSSLEISASCISRPSCVLPGELTLTRGLAASSFRKYPETCSQSGR